MENTITLSVDELKKLVNDEVQKALVNAKPVRDERMKELETNFKETVYTKKLDMNWYSAWNAIRMSVALKMGYRAVSKVPLHKYDELIENIKNELDTVLTIFTQEDKNGITNI